MIDIIISWLFISPPRCFGVITGRIKNGFYFFVFAQHKISITCNISWRNSGAHELTIDVFTKILGKNQPKALKSQTSILIIYDDRVENHKWGGYRIFTFGIFIFTSEGGGSVHSLQEFQPFIVFNGHNYKHCHQSIISFVLNRPDCPIIYAKFQFVFWRVYKNFSRKLLAVDPGNTFKIVGCCQT